MNKKPNPELIDDENPEWSDEMLEESIGMDALPASLQAKLKAGAIKPRINVSLSADVVDRFRATGSGWQTRIDAALKDWLAEHSQGQGK